jgi:hypothetical protein
MTEMHRAILPLFFVVSLACGGCVVAYVGKDRPADSIACSDWTHNANGTWTSAANAAPVTVYGTTQTLQSATVGPGTLTMGNPPTDLWAVLNQQCAVK